LPTPPIVLALVRHQCPCGAPYLVSLAADEELCEHPEWETGAAAIARAIGEELVDARSPGFFCPCCSRLHVRVSAARAASPYGECSGGEPLLSISLN
jgi:hypothetical protein